MKEADILLKAIMDGGKHSIIVTHPTGIVKVMNRAAERLYGYPAAHFVGRHISAFREEVYDPNELQAEVGKGTVFTFTLPRANDAIEASLSSDSEGLDSSRSRILICEDDHDVATLLKVLLDKVGFPSDVARNLAEAPQKLRDRTYVAMTLDLILPDGDGLELLAELRSDPVWKSLPVVVISAKADEGQRGMNGDPVELVDWVSKPLDEAALARSLGWATHKIQSKNPRILHVEDNEDMRKILESHFKGQVEWVGAATLMEARLLIQQEAFDLIVLDVALPDGNGLELLEKMNTFTGRPIPVLILSASEMDESIRKRVAAVLLKSRVSEERVVQTVLDLIQKQAVPKP